jgi:predicted HD phosphohydrolase
MKKIDIWKDLTKLYEDSSSYVSGLSQLDHALQAADAARRSGADSETIVAALLHDGTSVSSRTHTHVVFETDTHKNTVGWKLSRTSPFKIDARAKKKQKVDNDNADCVPEKGSVAESLGILTLCGEEKGLEAQQAQHDVIGATYLRMLGFVEKVSHLIEGHVLAKRYLCFKEKDYYEKLSPGSKRTLTFQGGIMSESEASLFEKDALFEASKRMRRWDENAKVTVVIIARSFFNNTQQQTQRYHT